MRLFPRPQPRSAFNDIVRVIRTPVPHKLGIAGVCAAITFLMILALIHDFTPKPVHRPPQIIYIKSWVHHRSEAQVIAQQKIDAPLEAAAKAKAKADDAAADTKRRESFERIHQSLKSVGIN